MLWRNKLQHLLHVEGDYVKAMELITAQLKTSEALFA
jgi:hypothetical protein